MKRIMTQLFAALMLFLFAMLPTFAAETYKLDNSHTYVLWHINHLGFSNQTGKWMADGTLVLDEAKPQNSKVDVTIDIGKIITGNPELDEHLMKDVFFDVKKYPTATFKSDKVTMTGKESAKVQGILTLHGVSKPVTLDVKLNKKGENPFTNKKSVGFSATTTIKRSDFGMNTMIPALGDDVKINVEAEGSVVG